MERVGASRSSHCLDFQLQREEGGKNTNVILDAWHWDKGNVKTDYLLPEAGSEITEHSILLVKSFSGVYVEIDLLGLKL